MGDEKSPLHALLEVAVANGDVKEVEALSLKAEHVEWVREKAFSDVRKMLNGEVWPSWRVLKKRLEMQLRVAEADRNALRARIAELEVRHGAAKMSALQYQGVWREQEAPYPAGSMCTFKGTLWYCQNFSADKPGTSNDWVLMVKHAKDDR